MKPPQDDPALFYAVRPDNTAIWLPLDIMEKLGIKKGDKLTPDQMGSPDIFRLLEKRMNKKRKSEEQ